MPLASIMRPASRKLADVCISTAKSTRQPPSWMALLGCGAGAGALVAHTSGCVRKEHAMLASEELPSSNVTATRGRIVLLGDSITQLGLCRGGWVQLLSERYVRRADVLNRGYSGYNTRWTAPVLRQLFADGVGEGAILWTVWLGANDESQPASHRLHVPLPEFEENLTKVVQLIKKCSAKGMPIILITPPAIDKGMWLEFLRGMDPAVEESDRTDEISSHYAAAVRRVAAATGAELLDVYTAMHSQEQAPGHFLSDGLHLSDAGQELVYRLLHKLIEERFPWLAVHADPVTGAFANSGSSSALPQEFPWHDELAAEAPYHPFFATLQPEAA